MYTHTQAISDKYPVDFNVSKRFGKPVPKAGEAGMDAGVLPAGPNPLLNLHF
jgi:hypothetical protein